MLRLLIVTVLFVSCLGQGEDAVRSLDTSRNSKVEPGSLAEPLTPELKKLVGTISLDNMDMGKLREFLSRKSYVIRLVDCIEDMAYCNIGFGYELHKIIVEAQTSQGDMFEKYNYTQDQKVNALNAIQLAVATVMEQYPDQYMRVENSLHFIDSRLSQVNI